MAENNKNAFSVAVFIINVLLVVLGYQFIKSADPNSKVLKEEQQTQMQPIDQKILNAQSRIATDRENKLRKLNNSPKVVKQNQTTTNAVTTVPSAPKATTKTKTS